MAVDVTMPQMGESVVEGTITKWLVRLGDAVQEDQPLVEISTDKVDTEIPSPAAGVVAQIIAAEGQTLPVGARLAVIEAGAGKEAPSVQAEPSPAGAPAPAPPRRAPLAPAPAELHARYSPLVMKMAAEHGIDLSALHGTGLGGRVTKRDVMNYLESSSRPAAPPEETRQAAAPAPARVPPSPPAVPVSPAPTAVSLAPAAPAPATGSRTFLYQPREGDQVEPFSRRRKLIAEHMVYSKTHSPHVGTVAEVDMTRAALWREAHKEGFRARQGFNLTFLPLVAGATVRALKEFPRMNASVVADALVVRKDINLGIAVDTNEGLLVPVIKAADQKSLLGLAREIENFARKAAERRITADDLAGGSFTVTNPGREGNLFGLAIINQPQVGILRMGEVKKRPVAVEVDGADAIAIRTIMYLALSYDHRVIDGVLGNRFLFRVARILEEADFEL